MNARWQGGNDGHAGCCPGGLPATGVLGCRRPTIMKHLRARRIPAINLSTNAKPNYRFCLESVAVLRHELNGAIG
jgi:hypothetical protein